MGQLERAEEAARRQTQQIRAWLDGENPYLIRNENLSLAEAEELARRRRVELGIDAGDPGNLHAKGEQL